MLIGCLCASLQTGKHLTEAFGDLERDKLGGTKMLELSVLLLRMSCFNIFP